MASLRSVTKRVREVCYEFAMSKEAKGYDYHKCPELWGMCSTTSFVLRNALRKAGFEADVYCGCYKFFGTHCWVECNGKILDVTASQFNYPGTNVIPDVVITGKDTKMGKRYRYGYKTETLHSYSQWHYAQKPSTAIVKLLTGRVKT